MRYTLGSLFDGSGGFPLAGTHYNIEPRWASEVEPYPIAVTRSRFPNMKHLGDISKINGAEIEPVDIITFGSPCQGLSVAGLRKGLEDERSGLFLQAVRIIKEMRKATNGRYPRFVLWENVPGALSSGTPKGEDFRIVLEELVKIAEPTAEMPPCDKNGWPYADSYVGQGWSLSYRIFDTQFWGRTVRSRDSGVILQRGTPQRRRRIHLILDLGGERAHAHEILFEPESLRRNLTQSGTPWEGAARDAENSIGAADRERKCFGISSFQSNAMLSDNPHSGIYEAKTSRTLDLNGGNPACNQGGIAIVESTVMVREQHLADSQPVALDKVSSTLRAGAGAPKHEQDILGRLVLVPVKEQYPFENHSQDTRYKDPLDICPMLPAQLGTGGNNTPFVVGKTYCLQGSMIGREDKNGPQGDGINEGVAFTVNTIDRHAVCYAVENDITPKVDEKGKAFSLRAREFKDPQFICYAEGVISVDQGGGGLKARDYKDATDLVCECAGVDCRNATEYPEMNGTLQAKANGGFSYNCNQVVRVRHIVRRLTPTECARLQGFPDKWGHPDHKDDFTDEEYSFWLDVRNTHAAINGKPVKDYTKQQMLTWYNKLHTDSAEYKMWGNGIALPPALYCMSGIAAALAEEGEATPEPAPQPAEEKKRVRIVAVRRIRK